METYTLARMFSDLEAAGVSEVERVSYTGRNPASPASGRVSVWISFETWRSVMDDSFYRNGFYPAVYAAQWSGDAVYLSAEVKVGQLQLTTTVPLSDFGEVDDLLLAAGVEERQVQAWRLLGGAA